MENQGQSAGEATTSGVTQNQATQGGGEQQGATSEPQNKTEQTGQQVAKNWYEGFSQENQNYIQKKGFTNPESVLESYINLEKLRGAPAERIVKLPESDDPADWAEVYDKLGRPKNKDDYDFSKLSENPDENFTSLMKDAFHESGMTYQQADKVLETMAKYSGEAKENKKMAMQAKFDEQEQALKKQWGAAFDQKIQNANLAMTAASQELGISDEQVSKLEQVIGVDKTMQLFEFFGSRMAEDTFHTGDGTNNNFSGAMTPQAAKAEVKRLIKDKSFQKQVAEGNVQAIARWNKLNRWASGQRA